MLKYSRLFGVFAVCAVVVVAGVVSVARSANSHPKMTEARVDWRPQSIKTANQDTSTTLYIPEGETTLTVESPTLTPELSKPFDVVGLTWEGELPQNTSIHFWLDKGGEWVEAPLVGDESKEKSTVNQFMTLPILFKGSQTRFKIELQRPSAQHDSPEVTSVQLVAVNAGDTPLVRRALQTLTSLQATSSPNIISRTDWGADETYRFTSDNEEAWPVTYQTPKKFIVHHTAGSTGGDDPAATVRAIYYWHAKVLGWGDIGYNYLVDEQGNIYEGRYGGDGAVGAHAYNDVREVNYNEGSVGIALLGCFEADDDGACSAIATPSEALETSLATLIGTKGKELNIRPQHSPTTFHDISIKNVVGHRDVDYTLCPGSIVHDDLAPIREKAQAVYDGLQPAWRAKFVSSDLPESLEAKTDTTLTVTWKNTGSHSWNQTNVFLKVYNKAGDPTPLASGWASHYGHFAPQEIAIAPGEKATFQIPLHTLQETSSRSLMLKIFHRKSRISTSTEPLIVHTIQPLFTQQMTVEHPVAVLKHWRPLVSIHAVNNGTETWPVGTGIFVNGELVAETTSETAPQSTATWTFHWTPPQTLGNHALVWKIKVGKSTVAGSKVETTVRVDKK